MRDAGRRLGPLNLVLLVIVALLDRVVGHGLRVMQIIDPEHALAVLQRGAAPFLHRFLLLTAALHCVLILPGFVLQRERRLERILFPLVLLGTLALMGLAIWRRAAGGTAFLAWESLLLALGCALASLALIGGRGGALGRLTAAGYFAALALPSLWRWCFEMAGGRFDEGGALERLRGLADLVSLIALGLVVLPTAIRGEWRALLAASPFGAAVLWFGLDRYEDVREVVQGATDLWLSSMPPTSTLALLVLGIVGVIAWPLGAWRRGRGMGVAIAVLLAAAAGFLPTANETFLLAWCGLATAVRASSGRIEARAGLARLFD